MGTALMPLSDKQLRAIRSRLNPLHSTFGRPPADRFYGLRYIASGTYNRVNALRLASMLLFNNGSSSNFQVTRLTVNQNVSGAGAVYASMQKGNAGSPVGNVTPITPTAGVADAILSGDDALPALDALNALIYLSPGITPIALGDGTSPFLVITPGYSLRILTHASSSILSAEIEFYLD